MEDNQTYINISDFQHNGTNYIQNVSCIVLNGKYQFWVWFCIELILYWVVFFIAFPGICFALYKLHFQVRPDQVAHVYVTNLLISDLIQTCANPIQMTAEYQYWFTSFSDCDSLYNTFVYGGRIYYFGIQVNVLFMMCVSAERYVMVAHPFWFQHIQNRKVSVIVSVTIWILSAVIWSTSIFSAPLWYMLGTVLLLPYPLVLFFFVATWRALSTSSIPHNDQIRIRSILGLILCIYTILFIPFTIVVLRLDHDLFLNLDAWYIYHSIAYILVALNPLFDLLLYVLIRKDVTHMCKALLFCCNKRQGADITHG